MTGRTDGARPLTGGVDDVKHSAGGVADQRVACKGAAVVAGGHHRGHVLLEKDSANG